MKDVKTAVDEGCHTRGRVTWLSSGEDEGPDCGLGLGLGDGKSMFIGELADQTIRDSGVEPKDFDGVGWWVAIEDGDHLQVVAAVADQDAARALHDAVAGLLAAAPAPQAVSAEDVARVIEEHCSASIGGFYGNSLEIEGIQDAARAILALIPPVDDGSRPAQAPVVPTEQAERAVVGSPKWGPEHCQIVDDEIDDVSLIGLAHLERMDKGGAYLGLYRADGSGYQIWLRATKGRLAIDHEELPAHQAPTPASVSPGTEGGE